MRALVLVFLFGCSSEAITQLVVVVVDTDLPPERVALVRIEVGANMIAERPVSSSSSGDAIAFPFSFGVSGGRGPAEIVVTALDGLGAPIVSVTAIVPFAPGEVRRAHLRLESACEALEPGCASVGQTCREAACADPRIPIEALEIVAPGRELEGLPPFADAARPLDAGTESDAQGQDAAPDPADASIDAPLDAGPICNPSCRPDELCELGQCRCGALASCGEAARCLSGSCVPWPRSCDALQRGCDVIEIAGGTFAMGDRDASADYATGAWPVQEQVTVSSFRADAYEVTVARFRSFAEAGLPRPTAAIPYPGGHSLPPPAVVTVGAPTETTIDSRCNWSLTPSGREEHPINCLTWATALAFCVWDGGRLPTEAEWEWMARGRPIAGLASGRDYPWGDEAPQGIPMMGCDRAQLFDCMGEDGAATRRVGSFDPSGGLFDLSGNVAEYVADHYDIYGLGAGMCWLDQEPGPPVPVTDPLCVLSDADGERVARGAGFFANATSWSMSAARNAVSPIATLFVGGVRCVYAP